jgi:putative flippase GtrA
VAHGGEDAATAGARRHVARLPPTELRRFVATGLVAYGVDVVVFNVLLLAAAIGPVHAKVLSSVAAITTAFIGSRWYTWADRPRRPLARQYVVFAALSIVAAGIQVLCIVVSNDVLGFSGPVADNLSANVVGMALATAFRYWTFSAFVFPHHHGHHGRSL